ncbi:tRNA (adenosine(37)-N6)-threonylcarbamoyltransferase complex ATPase subunit type 1 TsaE [Polycladidibacter hongkongensis]|uniref:tRNA (adenosine(37)-N6)-threonylcarbamoyltransferase complex ATPase subunit type 1 TsaE n=1 Tax=Polycladidibacter hongkongensis TaxID=1647556 RepID=UPI0008320418|nr:tRNA (adenosine(37)-N6)-threonylcarbamoyltransferase complex ATPase subunit type 1 TsaE [Pseudovibrio hongkongensis]
MRIQLDTQQQTEALAADIADLLQRGDVITLNGDLGTGKSTFSRALLRYLAQDQALEVPSPTFTIVQTYDLQPLPIAHYDLYRLEEPEELEELGLEDYLQTGAALIEWPQMGDSSYWPGALEMTLEETSDPLQRVFTLASDNPTWQQRLARLEKRRHFLQEAAWNTAQRARMKADASQRTFQRLVSAPHSAVLMDYPARTGEPVAEGDKLPYSQLVHLAQNTQRYLDITRLLQRANISVPDVFAAETAHGFALLEDLGSEAFTTGNDPEEARYLAAIEQLSAIHGKDWQALEAETGVSLLPYSTEVLLREQRLFAQYYLPFTQGGVIASEAFEALEAQWRTQLAKLEVAPPTCVLRDYHSPNIVWRSQEQGLKRLALVDFQDAVRGPAAYDVASLIWDARVDMPEGLTEKLLAYYCELQEAAEPAFDAGVFRQQVHLCGAQRNAKILGGFVRLAQDYGKPQYLEMLPRIERYLEAALRCGQLEQLRQLIKATISD